VSTRRPDVRAKPPAPDAEAAFREDFLSKVSQIGLGRDRAAAFVEVSTGRPFAACEPMDLLPVLGKLLALAQRTTNTNRRSA
jgi:hypothetical protein